MIWTPNGFAVVTPLLVVCRFGRASARAEVGKAVARAPDATIRDADIKAALRRKQYVEAIRLYRQRSGSGLKEARDAVDAMASRLDVRH